MKKSLILVTLIFLLSIYIVSAVGTETYPKPSGANSDWQNEGRGSFGTIGEDFDTFGRSLTAPLNMPIVADLDNNSVNELIIVDSDTVKIFQNKELNLISTVDYGTAATDISNILAFDIDGDAQQEIIFIDGTNRIVFIFNFTEADGIQIQRQFSLADISLVTFPMIGCRAANECIATLDSSFTVDNFNPFTAFYRGISFDSTNRTSGLTTIFSETQPSSDGIQICSPRTKNIIVNDYDFDGNDEYIISFADQESSNPNPTYHVRWLDNLTVETSGETDAITVTVNTGSCTGENGLSNLFTSPVTDDIRAEKPNAETFIAIQTDDDDFEIHVFAADGTKFHEIPDTLQADGVIMSNVMIGNFFPETGNEDVCVLGYDKDNQEIDLLCGTEDRGLFLGDDDEFKISVAGRGFNVSEDVNIMNVVAHAVQHSNVQTGLNDIDEVISPYGIFNLQFSGVPNTLESLFINPAGDSVIYSIDLEGFGSDDLIAMTSTNIFYFDDRLSNEPGEIVSLTFNPCITDSILKINTTLQIQAELRDTNPPSLGFDDMNADFFIYESSSNEQNASFRNLTTSQSDGTTTVITQFIVNQTGNALRFVTEAFDSENPDEIDSNLQTFSVQLTGLEFGDSTCTIQVAIPPEVDPEVPDLITESAAENSISNTLQALADLSGLSQLIWWTIFMAFAAIFIFIGGTVFNRGQGEVLEDSHTKLGVILVVEIALLIIGTLVGVVPIGITIAIVVVGLVVVSLFLNRMFTGTNNSG